MPEPTPKFETVVRNRRGLFDLDLAELFRYKDLMLLFVKRTFVVRYKQTILGPAWAIVQPLLTTIVFTIVFGNLAKMPTDGIPPFLFYMCGNIAWQYFANCLASSSHFFTANSAIFSKIYFPRLIMPIAGLVSHLISFAIQFALLIGFVVYYLYRGSAISLGWHLLLLPLILLQLAMLALGVGVIISSVTTKYRDLAMLVSFGTHLWMYGTPVAYSMSLVPKRWLALYQCNPVTPAIQLFRQAVLGTEAVDWGYYLLSWGVTAVILLVGIMMFNRVERTFMDTI